MDRATHTLNVLHQEKLKPIVFDLGQMLKDAGA